MQNLKPGDLVRVRRARWRVVAVRPYDACQLVTLSGVGGSSVGGSSVHVERRVIAPFDSIDRIDEARRSCAMGPRRWRRACRDLLAANTPPGGLRVARDGRMDLLPHQLEPALAILRGIGSRALLADDVGLGKTLQAGLIIAELLARGSAERILILTPAGVREQWATELAGRLGIDAAILDAAGVRRRAAALPVGFNPWTVVPIAIASTDYVKRPEVLPSIASCRWDIIVIDEAHHVAGDSDRFRAVDALSSGAAYVLLLTATPHSGDRRAFMSLCGIGARDGDPLMIFRRTRADVHLGVVRRVHRLHVRPTLQERRVHALLARFTRAVRVDRGDGAALALSVLHKRALSSARSLERSVERRLTSLAAPADGNASQLPLPLDDGNGELNPADDVPAWGAELSLADAGRERRMLGALRNAARAASANETKIHALRRLLRRIGEPAVVFTEYRDTLFHVRDALDRPAVLLHGGLSRDERATTLAEFSSGRCPLLLATDAAGEGLNLHQQCRLVINLELPWNPMRLEQRLGRVDRIGQRRTVHAVHLIARETGEPRILDRLRARLARARADIDVPDPVGWEEERLVAALMVGVADLERDPIDAARAAPYGLVYPSLRHEAIAEVNRLISARVLGGGVGAPREGAPGLMRARRSGTRRLLRGRILLILRAVIEDGDGRLVESTLIPVTMVSSALPLRVLRDGPTLAAVEHALAAQIAAPLDVWRDHAMAIAKAFALVRLRRERVIAGGIDDAMAREAQPGLFDRRVEAAVAAAAARRRDTDAEQEARLDSIERASALRCCAPRILLAIAP
jgi:superfamily II DNA or RNA helicase